jgi:hypothetical protein
MGHSYSQAERRNLATVHKQVIKLLISNSMDRQRNRFECGFASVLVSLINDFTGDQMIHQCKNLRWPPVKDTVVSNTISSRRTRLMDRVVRYGVAAQLSDADLYTCMFAISPLVQEIIYANMGRPWESSTDWYIYDIFARVSIISHMPDKLASEDWRLIKEDLKKFTKMNRANKSKFIAIN